MELHRWYPCLFIVVALSEREERPSTGSDRNAADAHCIEGGAIAGVREIGCRLIGVDPDDGQLCIVDVHDELVGHIVAVGIDDDSLAGNLDKVLACIGASGLGGQTLDGVGGAVDFELQGLETGYGLLGAVVGHGLGIGSKGNLVLGATIGDFQLSELGLDIVVIQIGSIVWLVGKSIVGGTGDFLRTGKGITYALTLNETRTLNGDGSSTIDQSYSLLKSADFRVISRGVTLNLPYL